MTAAANGLPDGGRMSPSELVIRRLKDGRARFGGISTYQLAERLAGLTGGGTKLSANVLQNLEAGRRQQAVTVDELLLLSLALDVPPEFFLAPPAGGQVQVTTSVVLDNEAFLAWVQGRAAVAGTDAVQYEKVSADVLGDSRLSGNAALKATFLRDAAGILEDFLADSDQIIHKTRGQVRELLGNLRDAVARDTSREELLTMIDDYLARLPAA